MNRDPAAKSEARIVHLTTVHRPFDPRIFYRQLRSLRNAGYDAHLVVPHDRTETVDGITIHGVPQPASRLDRLRLQPRVLREATMLDAALYQIHDPELLPMAYVLKKRSGAPVVYDMHENYRAKGPVAGRGLRALEQWGFSWLDHVLLAEESYDPIVADAAVEATRIPNYFAPLDAVTEDRDRRRVPRMSERPRLLYTGTISDSRGLRTMVDLARQCREQDRPETIHLAGMCRYPRQRARVEQRIQQEQLAPVLERQGWDVYLQPIELWKQYPGADVGLALFEPHPNYRDSMPTKFYEYLYFGLPIICSDVPRWREFVERHDCGAVVPPGDSSAVLEVIDEWTAHPERYRQLAENARDAAEEYQWGPVGERLVRVYRDLIENRRPTTVDA